MSNKKYTEQELIAAYKTGSEHSSIYWLLIGIAIGFIVGCGLTYIKLKH